MGISAVPSVAFAVPTCNCTLWQEQKAIELCSVTDGNTNSVLHKMLRGALTQTPGFYQGWKKRKSRCVGRKGKNY